MKNQEIKNILLNSNFISQFLITKTEKDRLAFSAQTQMTDSKTYKGIRDILKFTILHWICPIAIDVQENGNVIADTSSIQEYG